MEDGVWISVESKVRRLVKDILEPTIRRVQETKELTDKLLRKDENTTDKLNTIEIQASQTAQRVENLNNFSSKIIEAEASLRTLDHKTSGEIDKLFQKLSVTILDVVNLSERLRVLDNQRLTIEENHSGLEKSLLFTKNTLESRIDEVNENFKKKAETIEATQRASDSNIRQIYRKIEAISGDLAETDYLAKKSDRVSSENSEKLQNISKLILSNKKELQDSIEKIRNTMLSHNKDQSDSHKKFLKYLENDYKVSMNMSMMDHLYSVTSDPRSLHRIALHEREKLYAWASSSLNHSVKEAIERTKARCQAIIDTPLPAEPRPTNIIPSTSKENLGATGSKEGWRSSNRLKTLEQDLAEAEVLKIDPSDLSDTMQNENDFFLRPAEKNSAFPTPRGIFPEPTYMQNNTESAEMIDYMPYIQELRQIITELKEEFSTEISGTLKKIQRVSEEIDGKFEVLQGKQGVFIDTSTKRAKELGMLLEEAMHECAMVSNLRKRDLSDITTCISEVSSKVDRFADQFSSLEEEQSEVSKKLNSLMEISRINICLQKQDEIDRESISLMGYKETKPPSRGNLKKPVIAIDKMCQSCTGQASMVLSAFKMACLAYTPSQVPYASQSFTRKELIDIQKRMIEGISFNGAINFMKQAVEEKQKNRARSAMGARRFRPSSVTGGLNVSHVDIHSSIASDLPIVRKIYNN